MRKPFRNEHLSLRKLIQQVVKNPEPPQAEKDSWTFTKLGFVASIITGTVSIFFAVWSVKLTIASNNNTNQIDSLHALIVKQDKVISLLAETAAFLTKQAEIETKGAVSSLLDMCVTSGVLRAKYAGDIGNFQSIKIDSISIENQIALVKELGLIIHREQKNKFVQSRQGLIAHWETYFLIEHDLMQILQKFINPAFTKESKEILWISKKNFTFKMYFNTVDILVKSAGEAISLYNFPNQ